MFAQLNERHITKFKVRKNKEALKVFDKRKKVNEFKGDKKDFEMFFNDDAVLIKKKEDKLFIEVNYFRRISRDFMNRYEIEYNQIKFGNIDLYVIEAEEMKKMCLPFGGIASQNKIFTSNDENTIQHELQHAFENVLGISHLFKLWEREYSAFLGGMIFSDSKEGLDSIYKEVLRNNWNDETEKYYESEVHYKARLKIVSDLLELWVDRKSSEEQIKHGALILLDRIYKNKTGMSYSEIIELIKSE